MTMPTSAALAEQVRRRVAAALVGTPDAVRPIDVNVKDGHAVLCGTVRHWVDRNTAGRVAAGVPGIAAVDNQIALLVKGKVARR